MTTTGLPRAVLRSNVPPSSSVSSKLGAGRVATGTLPTVPAARFPIPQTISPSSAIMRTPTTSATTRADRALTSGESSALAGGVRDAVGDGAAGAVTNSSRGGRSSGNASKDTTRWRRRLSLPPCRRTAAGSRAPFVRRRHTFASLARSWPVPGPSYAIMPCRTAITAAWVRSLTPSF